MVMELPCSINKAKVLRKLKDEAKQRYIHAKDPVLYMKIYMAGAKAVFNLLKLHLNGIKGWDVGKTHKNHDS